MDSPERVDRLERLTDLVLVLLDAASPKTLEEISRSVPGYPESRAARRQAFERDKRILREEGIPVVTEPVEGPEQYGYRIDAGSLYLPDLGLSPDEQAALHLAVAAVHLRDPSGRDALAKLGASGLADARVVASLAPPGALAGLFDAVRTQSEVRFTYRGEPRTVAPAALRFRAGRWYLIGWDEGRGAGRTFRVDRIEGDAAAGLPGSAHVPDGFDAGSAPVEPWRSAEGEDHVLVRVDAVEAPRVVAEVGERAISERLGDGSLVLRLGVTSFELIRSWVLGLLDHAEIVGPPSARRSMLAWLDSMVAAGGTAPGRRPPSVGQKAGPEAPSPDPEAASRGAGETGDVEAAGRAAGAAGPVHSPPGKGASARLRRLLALVAWLAEVGEASIADIAERFGISEDDVVHELELAACCGIPPYTPDVLLEIMVSEDVVQAFLPKELARPRRLTPAEGLALAAAARTILAVPGADQNGALARALAKLQAVLGEQGRLVIDIDAPLRLDEVRAVLDAGLQVRIAYHSASTDETTVRVVEPLAVVSIDGHWYLDAWCQRAEGVRRFRIDRIGALEALGAPVTGRGREQLQVDDAFVPGPGAETVTLALDDDARWIADSVPVLASREGGPGAVEITVSVGGRAWLERLLLQAGPHGRVVAPAELAGLGPAAAARLRARYEQGSMKDHQRD